MKISKPDLTGISNLIFDFGGVLIDIDYEDVRKAFQAIGLKDVRAFYQHENHSKLVEDFEQGFISPDRFRDSIISDINKDISHSSFDSAWNAIIKHVPSMRVKLLQNLNKHYNLYLLSNTNIIHYNKYVKEFKQEHGIDLRSLFRKSYFSHEVKLRKPNPEIFEYVIEDAGLEKSHTLFIDDSEENVEASRHVGIPAFYKPQKEELVDFFNDRENNE